VVPFLVVLVVLAVFAMVLAVLDVFAVVLAVVLAVLPLAVPLAGLARRRVHLRRVSHFCFGRLEPIPKTI
jgi:hypothetical protein